MKRILGLTAFFCFSTSFILAQNSDEGENKAMFGNVIHDSASLKDVGNYTSILQNIFKPCKIESSYAFNSEIIADMYMTGKKPKDSFSISQIIYINNEKSTMGMDMKSQSKKMKALSKSRSIINLKDSCMIMLMETPDGKSAMSMRMQQADRMDETDTLLKMSNPTKTGKSKVILGVLCHEYLSENQEWEVQMWVNEKETNMWDSFSQGKQTLPMPSITVNGMPLEMVMKHRKEEKTIYYFVRSIDRNKSNTISTLGYKTY